MKEFPKDSLKESKEEILKETLEEDPRNNSWEIPERIFGGGDFQKKKNTWTVIHSKWIPGEGVSGDIITEIISGKPKNLLFIKK